MTIVNVPLTRIQPNPWQTRRSQPSEEYIEELARDIAANGLLQMPVGRMVDKDSKPVDPDLPAVVLDMNTGKDFSVQLAFGHNRLEAFRVLAVEDSFEEDKKGYDLMPVEIKTLTDQQMAVMAWSENEKRRDVTAIERALAIQKRIEDFKWSNRECAEALGIDHTTVANILRLLKLPEELQKAIQEGKLSERQAVALLPLYEAPVEFKLLPNSYSWSDSSPSKIVKAALDGSSSDYIRAKVSDYFESETQDLAKAEFKLDQLIPEEGYVYCGLCTTCDKRMASRNCCFSKLCYEAKTEFVHREYLKKASFSSGYPLIDDKKSGSPTTLPWEESKRQKILATKCQNLCLEWTGHKSETSLEHFPHARIVCEMRMSSCRCLKGLAALKDMDSTPAVKTGVISAEEYGEMITGEIKIETGEVEQVGEGIQQEDPTTSLPPVATRIPTPEELEELARQARKDARDAINKLQEYSDKLKEHLYQHVLIQSPGAFWAALNHSPNYYGRTELTIENIWRSIADAAARAILPGAAASESEIVRQINLRLDGLNLSHLGSFEEATREDVTFPEL